MKFSNFLKTAVVLAAAPVVLPGCSGGGGTSPSLRLNVPQSPGLVANFTNQGGSLINTFRTGQSRGEFYPSKGGYEFLAVYKVSGSSARILVAFGKPTKLAVGDELEIGDSRNPDFPGSYLTYIPAESQLGDITYRGKVKILAFKENSDGTITVDFAIINVEGYVPDFFKLNGAGKVTARKVEPPFIISPIS